MATPERRFYVSPPTLPSAQKKQYLPAKEILSLKEDARIDEVIGEHHEGDDHFYYARYEGGIAHKFHAADFERKYDKLVNDYRVKKRAQLLKPFEPSASYVHPLSRPKAKTGNQSGRSSRVSHSVDTETVPPSEEEESAEDDAEDDEEYEEDEEGDSRAKTPPRSVRPGTRKELPFSPKKTRARRLRVIESESEASVKSTQNQEKSLRRSNRSRKGAEIVIESDAYSDEGAGTRLRKSRGNSAHKKSKVKSVQPMYGHFRAISTLDEDPFSDDEENEVLRRHRKICEKCYQPPAHTLLEQFRKKAKRQGKKRKRSTEDEFEESEDEDNLIEMGGWVQCLKCPVSAHWKCLASTQRDEVLRAARERDQKGDFLASTGQQKKRGELDINETTEFLCGACSRGGICIGCSEDVSLPAVANQEESTLFNNEDDAAGAPAMEVMVSSPDTIHSPARELLFRCLTCKRPSHYAHLPAPTTQKKDTDDYSVWDIAKHYQGKQWLCADCSSYTYGLDKIIAWRPYPPTAKETYAAGEGPHYKSVLPREYLVKWEGRSYRRLDWVPHMWLLSTNGSKLKNFINGGMKVELLKEPEELSTDPESNFLQDGEVDVEESASPSAKYIPSPFDPLPDAEKRIPRSWKTVDRVLDVVLWVPHTRNTSSTAKRPSSKSKHQPMTDNSELLLAAKIARETGEEPPEHLTLTVDQWEQETQKSFEKEDPFYIEVAWAFIKWEGLGYDECTWDVPPGNAEQGKDAFSKALERYIKSLAVYVPKHPKAYWKVFDNRTPDEYRKKHILKKAEDLNLGQSPNLKLMPFQVDGFNWLCNNWWNHQHCILADEMGLGKTVQIVTFLGNIISNWQALPALVVVPNSTITNWVREFERWAPELRVVPFSGDKAARDVIKEFELFHKSVGSDKTKAKFHVLITTYETLTGAKDFTAVFKNQPRWEVLVVDEGQRLKSDSSLLFRKLNELNTAHRIIMTGTPLNNNIRELFNLMNFLDPEEWNDLEALEKEHETLSEELVKQLHTRLRPYFLRRIKSEVLDLPPKNEVIVPVSMAPLQREVYRSILSNNLNILNNLAQTGVGPNAPAKARINNVLMQLRKCLQHPYLYAEDIEPRGLGPVQTHEKLIDGSAKLRFLKALLPKLKERGHRVLLFSQFVIALNIVEDFLNGEGYKFLRLDGNTKGGVRQKMMDEYNKPGSEYFIFLLTTRAGGVGINLFSADTVIIFDPDFNPHQDLQAIARAYRYGQEKTCLVFKLMVKESAEERIMQIGKKKLVLDHLIVQKMDDDDENGGEDVQSILTYGAQALFESGEGHRDIQYSDYDITNLLEKTEKEAVKDTSKAGGGLSFSFAKVWAADKDSLEDIVEEDQKDSWAQALAKINEERAKEVEREVALSGRGGRRKAADIAKSKINGDVKAAETPNKTKAKAVRTSAISDGSAYSGSDHDESSGAEHDSDPGMLDDDFVMLNGEPKRKGKSKRKVLGLAHGNAHDEYVVYDCPLCGKNHLSGECAITSAALAEYREMLILNPEDEPWEDRRNAVETIDEILHQRGDLSLIAGQPLHPLEKPILPPSLPTNTVPPLPRSNGIASSSTSSNIRKSSSTQKQSTRLISSGPIPQKRPLETTSHTKNNSAIVGPSLQYGEPTKKKAKVSGFPKCRLCGKLQVHSLDKCPTVLAGPKSIFDQIVMLEGETDPVSIELLQKLRQLWRQSKAGTLSSAGPSKFS